MGKDSVWQRGKDFLWGPRSEWPIERRFATDRKAQIQIPTTEINQKYRNMLPSQQTVVSLSQLEVIAKKETELKVTATKTQEVISGPEDSENPIVKLFDGGYSTNDWEVLIEKTAILFRWLEKVIKKKQDKMAITARNMAVVFWVKVAMPATRKAYNEKKLPSLLSGRGKAC